MRNDNLISNGNVENVPKAPVVVLRLHLWMELLHLLCIVQSHWDIFFVFFVVDKFIFSVLFLLTRLMSMSRDMAYDLDRWIKIERRKNARKVIHTFLVYCTRMNSSWVMYISMHVLLSLRSRVLRIRCNSVYKVILFTQSNTFQQ